MTTVILNLNEAEKLITTFTKLSLKAYRDGKVIKIGYGSTYKNIKLTDKLTNKVEANYLLIDQLYNEYLPKLEDTIPHWKKLNVNQKNALLSFAYDVGAEFYNDANFAALAKYLEEPNYSMVPKTLLSNGKNNKNRRQLEGQLFSQQVI